jgi:hypothetical protein
MFGGTFGGTTSYSERAKCILKDALLKDAILKDDCIYSKMVCFN